MVLPVPLIFIGQQLVDRAQQRRLENVVCMLCRERKTSCTISPFYRQRNGAQASEVLDKFMWLLKEAVSVFIYICALNR